MKKKLLHVSLTFFVLFCCLILNACGNGDSSNAQVDDSLIFNAEYIAMPEELGNISNLCYQNGTLYFFNYAVVGVDEPEDALQPRDEGYYEGMYDVYGYQLCKMNVDGSGYQALTDYQTPALPEGSSEGDISPNYLYVDGEGNLWVSESGYLYHIDENDNWIDDGTVYFIRKLDATGKEILSVDLSKLTENNENYFYISSICTDKDGNLYFGDGSTNVYVYDSNGQPLFDVAVSEWVNGICRLADGSVGVLTYENSEQVLKKIDVATKDWGESAAIPSSAYNIISGGGDYDFYYQDGSNLYGYNLANQTEKKLINWIDSDINSDNLQNIIILEDGRIVCTNYVYDYTGTSGESRQELIVLTQADPSTIVEKTDLTMAVMWLNSDLRNAVINFNKTNDQYRIRIIDYSEYNTEEDYNAGLTKLNTEIISGNVPDILDVSSLSIQKYISKGLLENLYTYLEADEELSKDSLMPGILKAMEIDGGLYQAFPSFNITTWVGATSVVGEEMGWTIDEFAAVWDQMPEGSVPLDYMTKSDFLTSVGMLTINDYVDWQTGQCSFDSPEFIKLLELANRFPDTYDWESEEAQEDTFSKIQSGKVFLSAIGLADFQEYQTYKQLFGGEITYIGIPCSEGNGSVATVNSGLAMSSKCQHKDGAWQFIRTLFTEDYQKQYVWWGYPSNKNVFEEKKAEAMKVETTVDENGNVVPVPLGGVGYGNGMSFEIYPMTEEDAEQLMAVINGVDSVVNYDQSMMDIISEEAAPFFAGQKNAQETAAIIQSRVNIYVNEQR